jgi:hypothetical protein
MDPGALSVSTKAGMVSVDAAILAACRSAGLTDLATIGGVDIEGYFIEELVDAGDGEDGVTAQYRAFDCVEADLPTSGLADDEEVVVADYGTFRFLRSEPDESGRTILVLGRSL